MQKFLLEDICEKLLKNIKNHFNQDWTSLTNEYEA